MGGLREGYEKLEKAWAKAEEYIRSLHCPVPCNVEVIPEINLGWEKYPDKEGGKWQIVVIMKKNDQREVFILACVKTPVRVMVAAKLEELIDKVQETCREWDNMISKAADHINRTLENYESRE